VKNKSRSVKLMLNLKICNKKINSRGFTLVELIISIALGVIITTAAYSLYVGVLHVASRLQGERKLMQRIRVITEKLEYDLGQTDLKKTTIINDEKPGYKTKQANLVAIAMPRAYGKDDDKFQTVKDTGLPIWKSLHIYYKLPGSSNLRMKEVYFQDPSKLVLPISEKELEKYCDGKDDQLVADNVTYFNPQPVKYKKKESSTDPKDRLGRMDIYITLFYKNKKGLDTYYQVKPTFVARNSYYEKPGPLHTPIPTPTPPHDAPITPSDWTGSSVESEDNATVAPSESKQPPIESEVDKLIEPSESKEPSDKPEEEESSIPPELRKHSGRSDDSESSIPPELRKSPEETKDSESSKPPELKSSPDESEDKKPAKPPER